MDNAYLVAMVVVSTLISVSALVLAGVTISIVVGFKNSTHTIEWKPLENHVPEEDPFAEPELPTENPNKRRPVIKNPFPAEEVKEDVTFADLEDPNVTSNNW